MPNPKLINFDQFLDALEDIQTPLPPAYLYRLSDLDTGDLKKLATVWPKVAVQRRQAVMEDIEELGDKDTLLNFEGISRLALTDEDPHVREIGIRSLWEYDYKDLADKFISLLEKDKAVEVRAAASSALGKYVYLGELEEIPASLHKKVEDHLIEAYKKSDDILVHRRALEALGFSSRDEVPPMIENAYYSNDSAWVSSALFAMGRSANERWLPLVEAMLDSEEPEVLFEAVRAAGELEHKKVVPRLIRLLNTVDNDTRLAIVWSLSQIGGEGIHEILEQLYEKAKSEEDAELIEDALDNLSFTNDTRAFALLEFAEEDLSSFSEDDDLIDYEYDEESEIDDEELD